MDVLNPAPLIKPIEGLAEAIRATLGAYVVEIVDAHFELSVTVVRDDLARAMELLRDRLAYQQLMEIAGVDYPDRAERFEVCYHLLSVTKNHRLRVKVQADESNAVPSVTHLWPVAGWLEREVFDMYGVLFSGNADLRRILTDYGFKGYPFRKDFPLTGYVEMRYSEELKRVVYEPVRLAQDFRSFDFMSPWEGADYILPGDEKAPAPPSPPPPAPPSPPVATPKTTDKPADTGAGEPANTEAAKPSRARKSAAAKGEAAVAKPKATRTRKPKAPTKAEGGDA